MTDLLWARDLAHLLADEADRHTLAAFRGELDIATKADGTWVTEVDLTVEQRLRDLLLQHAPDHAVHGEERGLEGDASAPRWVIDPIDGTSNFVRGNPIFATLIGLRVDAACVVGVVSAPALGTRFDGAAGHGARQDGRAIAVSDRSQLADAEVSFGDLDRFRDAGRWDAVGALTDGTARQRSYGDFWHHCLVAAGSTDVAIEAAVNPWDIVAVQAVVEAAGGRASSLDGGEACTAGHLVTSNGQVHDQVLELLRGARG